LVDHPTRGTNELWRSNAYDSVATLTALFLEPRIHTGLGYRRSGDRKIACNACGELSDVKLFSKNQQRNPVGQQKCTPCIEKKKNEPIKEVTEMLSAANLSSTPSSAVQDVTSMLSAANLSAHDKKTSSVKQELERRQFCCANHPRPHIFFKKVPKFKPVQKCPECKKINHAAPRLVAVAKDKEKGYGHFRCTKCPEKWGSSRAMRGCGMFCLNPECFNSQNDVPIYPYQIQPWKKSTKKKTEQRRDAAGPISSMVVNEDQEESHGYQSGTAVGGGNDAFEHKEKGEYDFMENPTQAWEATEPNKSTHRCTGCAKGLCNDKRVPVSAIHQSTGSTNSSSGRSGKTFSTVDESDYEDRDPDFA